MFYSYLWLWEDGSPYYAGKGKEDRAFKKNKHRQYPPPKDRIVIYPAKSEVDAFETEVALIWYYGRKDLGLGCLRNLTDGGEGASGYKHTEASRRKMEASQKGRKHTGSTRRKISEANTGKPKSEKHRKTIAAMHVGNTYCVGRKYSIETLEKLRKAVLGKEPRRPATNLVGRTFGLLTVLNRAPKGADKEGRPRWLCLCACDAVKSILSKSLLRNNGTRSCGSYACRKK